MVFDAWVHLNNEVYSTFDHNICTECDSHNVSFTEEEDNENGAAEPNDTLTAAAPELLAACHRVLDYWNGKGRYVKGVDVDDIVKAAIAKAEGKTT